MLDRAANEHTSRPFEGQPRPVSLGIDQYFWVLRRQWRLIGALTLFGIIAAIAYLAITPIEATAKTKLTLNVIMTDPFSSQRPASGLLDASTESAIAGSHVVAEKAAKLLGSGATAAEVSSSYEVSLSSSATVVTFAYTAASQDAAVRGADTVAQQYLAFRQDQADRRVTSIAETLTREINKLNIELDLTNEAVSNTPLESAQHEHALAQQRQLLTEIEGLLTQRNALRAVDTTGGTVLSSAQDNEVSFAPSKSRILLFGAAGGLVLGVLFAFIRNPRDRRLRGSREMSRILRAPVLTATKGVSAREPLEIAKQRLLTDFRGGEHILILDTGGTGKLSPTAEQISGWFAAATPEITFSVLDVSDPAEIIAMLRNSDAAVAVCDPATSRTDTLQWFTEEAQASSTPVLGIIEVPTMPRANK